MFIALVMIRILILYFKPEGQPSQDAAIQTMEKCISDIQSWMIDSKWTDCKLE